MRLKGNEFSILPETKGLGIRGDDLKEVTVE